MNFKVGEKVRIKNDLMTGKTYNNEIFSNGMKRYRGQIGIICQIIIDKDGVKYRILIDNNQESLDWFWTDEMLETYTDVKEEKIKVVIKNKATVVVSLNNEWVGSSQWNGKDKYDEKIGILIATARALGFDKKTVQGFINVIFKEDDKKKESINKEDKSNCHCSKDECKKQRLVILKNSEKTNKKDIQKKETSKSTDDGLMEFLFTIGLLKELF